ncbi:MAG: hypothetical protein J0H82_23460 [Alphaproteobacteria bacterium]|jgi:hypothetical protein|nr:hypothetical protein [Alphaproteobacteria bacterium]
MSMPIAPASRLDWLDLALVAMFLAGIYLGVSLPITAKIPLTAAPSGLAGLVMLWRRRDEIDPAHLAGLFGVLALYLVSVLVGPDLAWLSKRFTGFLQLSYSLVIGYGLFLTMIRADRDQLSRLFLGFCLFMLIGCLLESYAGLRPVSDAVRMKIYDSGVYDSDLRDQILYGRIRPKWFTSEPSAVTFAYTLYGFAWLVLSRWRWKLLGYLAMAGVGVVAMPGPTLLLMLVLVMPYELFVAGRVPGQPASVNRAITVVVLSALLLIAAAIVGSIVFAERLRTIDGGNDPSFFFRVTGPMLVALEIFKVYPWAGAGLTAEPFIADLVMNVFVRSPQFSAGWDFSSGPEILTNYFWLHWIYLGIVMGGAIAAALALWLRQIGVPSALFCFMAWAVLGQASGAYVGPKTWAVLYIAAGAATLAVGSLRRATGAASEDWAGIPASRRAWR